jgi:C4-dicarboxylate-specific signal transduction histidine kinase
MMKFGDEGGNTGRLVVRVLRRAPGARMPPPELMTESFVVDWRQLQRFGLSESRLPPGTEVLYRDPTLWERYRALALVVSAIIVAQSALVAGLLVERRRRKRAQAAIAKQEELNRVVLASVSTQIAILDRMGTIIRVNEAWRQLARGAGANETHEAFVGWNYLEECRRAEIRGCDEAREARLGIEAVLEGRRWPFRHEFNTAPPHELRYELFVDRLQLSEGGAIVTHLDVTERRLAEQRAEETRRQVAHMGRLALVGELGATISHELRQPLAAIRANAQAGAMLLAGNPPDLREVQAILQDIVADDARAVEVIEGVRRLLRKDEPLSATVDLNQICRDAARLLQTEAALRHTRIDLTLAAAAPLVTGDPAQLRQMVLNLGLNALEAASGSSDERAVVVSTTLRAGQAEVTVHDSGPGISADVQPRVFEPFFSTKSEGLGLGLAIVRSIAERHQGRVWAENHTTGGAVFGAALPAARGLVSLENDAAVSSTSDPVAPSA